jgi:hypothetical protein
LRGNLKVVSLTSCEYPPEVRHHRRRSRILDFREQGSLHPTEFERLGGGKAQRLSQIDERDCVMTMSPTEKTNITAEMIAKALSGRKVGSGWTARCPAHQTASRASQSATHARARSWSAAMRVALRTRSSMHCGSAVFGRKLVPAEPERQPAPAQRTSRMTTMPRAARAH